MKRMLSYLAVIIFFFCSASVAQAAEEGTNKAAVVLCDIILFLRGRYGRSLSIIAIMSTSWGFILGHISWQRIVALIVGFSLLFGAEGFAFIILPSQISGIEGVTSSGFVFERQKVYTPQQIVKHICPELVRL